MTEQPEPEDLRKTAPPETPVGEAASDAAPSDPTAPAAAELDQTAPAEVELDRTAPSVVEVDRVARTEPARDGADDPLMWFPAEGERHVPRAAPRRKQQGVWWLWVGLAVVAVLAVGGVAAWVVTGGMPAPSVPSGTVAIESDPLGAEVWVDGQSKGVTPIRMTLEAGVHVIVVKAGEARREIRRRIEPGSQVYEYIDLPTLPETGRLSVVTRPPGARVLVDGEPRGVAPVVLDGLSPGQHTVRVTDGVSTAEERITVEPGQTASVVVPLAAAGAGNAGWISVACPVTLQILEGDALLGTSESDRIMVASGRHTFGFRNASLGFSATEQVTVTPGRVARVEVQLPHGTLHVNAVPWAEVLLDGRSVGETPLANLQVPIGSHELVFRNPQYPEQRRTVTIGLTAPTRLGVDLRK